MFEEKALNPSHLPIHEKHRKSTDIICTLIAAAFALTLFITACVLWNRDNFVNKFSNVKVNGKGQQCGEQQKLFIHNYTDVKTGVCVKQCPAGFDQAAAGICLPENENQFLEYLQNEDIAAPVQFPNFRWVLFYTFIVSLGLGALWATITHCFPRQAPILAHIFAPLALIAFGILILILNDNFFTNLLPVKITVATICFILAILCLVMVCLYANQIKFQGLFLDYSTRFFAKHTGSVLYLFIYLIFMAGLVALTVWQHCCFASQSAYSRDIYNFNNSGVWEILNILEFIWAAQFLRDSYNFCLSGNATDYYWRDQQKLGVLAPYNRLICSHWGSVVGGSFLNAFFQIPTLLVQLITCHPKACCSKMGTFCYNSCNCFTCFFDLVRTDSYSYINISGIPFCNASRECRKICENSKNFIGVHSPIKHYRFVAHVLLVSLALISGWFILRARLWVYGFWNIVLIIVVAYITITLFIDLHANPAEGLQTSYLSELQLQPNHSLMQRLDVAYAADLDHWQRRQKYDGNC